jgi:hypothetical protein
MGIMVLVLTMNLIPDPQRFEEEKLVTRTTLSQYPPMTGHMAKAIREIPNHLTRITLLMVDTIKTKLFPAIRPICHHQSIKHSRSLREELSYVIMTANGDEAVMLAAEMSRHDGRLVEMVDPRRGNLLDMTSALTAVATRIIIALPAAAMTKGKAPTTMTIIQLHVEQREAVAVVETHRRTSRARYVTLYHPHQAAPMAAAVAAQPGHVAPEKIRRITSPMTRVPTETRLPSLKQPSCSAQSALDSGSVMSPSHMGSR